MTEVTCYVQITTNGVKKWEVNDRKNFEKVQITGQLRLRNEYFLITATNFTYQLKKKIPNDHVRIRNLRKISMRLWKKEKINQQMKIIRHGQKRGHNIDADGWAGAYKPHPPTQTITTSASKMRVFAVFNFIITDGMCLALIWNQNNTAIQSYTATALKFITDLLITIWQTDRLTGSFKVERFNQISVHKRFSSMSWVTLKK